MDHLMVVVGGGTNWETRDQVCTLCTVCPGLLVEWLTHLTYKPRRVSALGRSRPEHIQSCEYKEGLWMRLKTVVACTRVYARASKRSQTGGQ
jgi:hypothetical protein